MATTDNTALDWDSEYEDNGSGFILLDPGYYPFTVDKLEKEYYEGSEKVPPCPRASLTLKIQLVDGRETSVFDSILLYSGGTWRVNRFFEALGFQKEPSLADPDKLIMKPHWGEVIGKQGWVKIKNRSYTTKNGEDRTTNDIDEYVDPKDWNKALASYQQTSQPAAQPAPVQQQQAQTVAAPQPQQAQMPMPAQPQQYQNPYSMD